MRVREEQGLPHCMGWVLMVKREKKCFPPLKRLHVEKWGRGVDRGVEGGGEDTCRYSLPFSPGKATLESGFLRLKHWVLKTPYDSNVSYS